MRIYLDTCCLNRPFDDQTQPRIRLESEAIRLIIGRVENAVWTLAWSDALDLEISKTRNLARRSELERFRRLADVDIRVDDSIQREANVLQASSYGAYDALHIACAEAAMVDVFLSTDDRLLRKASGQVGKPRITIASPLDWMRREVSDEHRDIDR
jgi:predicted nucleic acid-binding protein